MSTAEQTKNSQYFIDLEDKHGAHNYHPLPVVLDLEKVFSFGM
jgi:ornithine--oxo-acid transaminase